MALQSATCPDRHLPSCYKMTSAVASLLCVLERSFGDGPSTYLFTMGKEKRNSFYEFLINQLFL